MRFLLPLFLILSGCVGPLVVHETARTLGSPKHHEFSGGYGNAGYVLKWNMGLLANWDFGIQYESLSWGLRTKYAFINSTDVGFSLAAAAGAGLTFGGTHYYGDLIASYMF